METREKAERIKSDIAVIAYCSGIAFTQLGTLVPFVMKESGFQCRQWQGG